MKNAVIVVLIFILLCVTGAYLYLRLQSHPSSRRLSAGSTNSPIEVVSAHAGINVAGVKKDALVDHLSRINFWREGVMVFDGPETAGSTTIESIRVILTDQQQAFSTYKYDEGTYSYSWTINPDSAVGTMTVGVQMNEGKKPEKLEEYILLQLYKVAKWPRNEYTFYSEKYNDMQKAFAEDFLEMEGGFIEYR